MILTGKAKRDFINWIDKEHDLHYYNIQSDLWLNALIIEWFDSEGHIGDKTIIQILIECLISYRTITEATEEAIKKANEIYNNL